MNKLVKQLSRRGSRGEDSGYATSNDHVSERKFDFLNREQSQRELVIASAESFMHMLRLERRRSERSRTPFLLVLVEFGHLHLNGNRARLAKEVSSGLFASTRETDLIGWYDQDCSIGVIFTQVDCTPEARSRILDRVRESLAERVQRSYAERLRISCHVFSHDETDTNGDGSVHSPIFADLTRNKKAHSVRLLLKRCLDIVGSSIFLILFAPLFIAIAALIKLTSPGPILFRQTRLGQYGKEFSFLKFRSMQVASDTSLHREYVTNYIRGQAAQHQDGSGAKMYKLTRDPRITPIGRIIRKTSLDEIPQFINVLRGEMSLVGPRPPIPYELQAYDLWHRRRLLEAKPGITGLWQVSGRCRVRFDEMVRLDLKYAKEQSLWLDLRILLETPRAVVSGDGAH